MTEIIESGNYVRTKNGYIYKISYWDDDVKKYIEISKGDWTAINPKDIDSYDKEIIKLVKCGDFVNGSKVIDIAEEPVRAVYTENMQVVNSALLPITNERIKSVVTKEQFERMEVKKWVGRRK